jgi:protoheme IX farnesyltransferase
MSELVKVQRTLWNYFEALKLKESSLHVFMVICAVIVAAEGNPFSDLGRFLIVLAAVVLGCTGSNGLTNYFDREIDAIMVRTSHRALPSRRIYPPQRILLLSVVLVVIALVLAWFLHPQWPQLCFFAGLAGVLSAMLWRKRMTCVFQGAIASCAPVLVGYWAFNPHLSWTLLFICLLIFIWVPVHVWSIMIAYRDDYIRGGLTFFPMSWEVKDAIKVLLLLSILLYSISLALWYVASFGWLFFVIANILGIVMIYANLRLLLSNASKDAWKVYKLSAFPYLGLIFLAMCLNLWIL